MRLEGIHHVTAITADVLENVDFYTRVLGLRLVGKSINQDDPTVYHVYYSDEHGRPGAALTFFEYRQARAGRAGAGMVHRITWRLASEAALDFWSARLAHEGVPATRTGTTLVFADREGLTHEFVIASVSDEPRVAAHPGIPLECALQGFHGVRAYGGRISHSAHVLEAVLGGRRTEGDTWELRGDQRGGTIAFDPPPADKGIAGAGTVHHVAWNSPPYELAHWVEQLAAHGVHSTQVIDRFFFQSIYFREPSGVLYEIASDGPGFGPEAEMGQKLLLPPWFEAQRASIEAGLTPIPPPR